MDKNAIISRSKIQKVITVFFYLFIFKRCTPHRNNSIIFFVILFQLVNVAYNYDGRSNCPLVMLWNRERDRKTWKINGKNYYQINSINMSERNRKETENVNIIKWMTEWKLHFFVDCCCCCCTLKSKLII